MSSPSNVVIVESPAKAKTINKYLGSDYIVLASYGHIRDLPSKEGSVLPDNDFEMKWLMSPSGKKRMIDITNALVDANTIILATDHDREGEAISWHIAQELLSKNKLDGKKVQRVTFNEITKNAIHLAFQMPRELDYNLIQAYMARRALDYLVGFTLSPVLWRKLPGAKSAGRVQSVALRIICEREAQIEAFKPEEFWTISVPFKEQKIGFTARLTQLNGEQLEKFTINSEDKAMKAKDIIGNGDFKIVKVDRKSVKRNPYAPFTTSTMQQEASRKLHMSPARTMQIAQKLYEGVMINGEQTGLITYMRTDGITLSNDAVGSIRNMIGNVYGNDFLPNSPRMYKSKSKNAQEAHEAIRPTDIAISPKSVSFILDKEELALYELIWKRTIACQMESAVLDQTALDISNNDGSAILRANGSVIKFQGFLSAYAQETDEDNKGDDENASLPALSDGNVLKPLSDVDSKQSFTNPPPRFSEASIIKTMEELGIGRPSTYTSILKVLQDRDYVSLDKRRLIPSDRGRIVTTFLSLYFNTYFDYGFTANLEQNLDTIAEGKAKWKQVLEDFWKDFSTITSSMMEVNPADIHSEIDKDLGAHFFPVEESRKCPSCKTGRIGLNFGKFGAYVACGSYPDCKYSRQLEAPGESSGDLYPKELGEVEGKKITIKKGPYGFYVEKENEPKPKRTSLPKNINPEDLALEQAIKIVSLPRDVGNYPETGEMITASIGRFGPFFKIGAIFISLPASEDVLEIGINRAVKIVSEGLKKKAANAPRPLGKHPEDEADVAVQGGRYGPYIKWNKVNAPLPRGTEIDDVSFDDAMEALKIQLAKNPLKKAKAKKSSGKKASAKK